MVKTKHNVNIITVIYSDKCIIETQFSNKTYIGTFREQRYKIIYVYTVKIKKNNCRNSLIILII